MEYLKYNPELNLYRSNSAIYGVQEFFLDVGGRPFHMDQNGQALKPVSDYVLEMDSFVNDKRENIRFYRIPKQPDSIIVYHERFHMEQIYTLGKFHFMSNEEKEEGIPRKIKSFGEVISAWKSGDITF